MGMSGSKANGSASACSAARDVCPACNADLHAGSTPLHSIVLCARCCVPLLWDGRYTLVTTEQIDRLSERDRVRLYSLAALQRARSAARGAPN
jgi:hypothetical protein